MRRIPAAVVLAFSVVTSPCARVDAQPLEPTTQTSIGIFYQPGAPEAATLWRDGDDGQKLHLRGRVLNPQSRPVAGALVELWHADSFGGVDESRYRAALRTKVDGSFEIRTVLPGHIEMARYNSVFAPRHVHVVVSHPDYGRLVSLIFFKGDERLADSPYPELSIVLERAMVSSEEVLFGHVELVIARGSRPPADEYLPLGD